MIGQAHCRAPLPITPAIGKVVGTLAQGQVLAQPVEAEKLSAPRAPLRGGRAAVHRHTRNASKGGAAHPRGRPLLVPFSPRRPFHSGHKGTIE